MGKSDHRSRRDRASERTRFLTELRSQGSFDRRSDHKTPMLCRQVHRALNLALGSEIVDPVISDVMIVDVVAAPTASHLVVRVTVPAGVPLHDLLGRLARATPALRASIAQAISRKRVPELSFIPYAEGGDA